MKRVLITGKNSYIGRNFKSYAKVHYPNEIQVDSISVRDEAWRDYDFSQYDTILHVAALVHKGNNHFSIGDYTMVNTQLPLDIADKANKSGVKQFIFMSTMSVYGLNTGYINATTPEKPTTPYGISKLNAEHKIESFASDHFQIAIIRPPMIYGKDAPGNYGRLRSMILKFNLFPDYKNKRSMLYIDNLSNVLCNAVLKRFSGTFFPQNLQYVCTFNLVKAIGIQNKHHIRSVRIFNPLIALGIKHVNILKKVFGNLTYDRNLSAPCYDFIIYNFRDTIIRSER